MNKVNDSTEGEGKTIVFADDDLLILEAITEILKAKGYAVHTAQDGLEALALIRKVKPDYIILDVVLPKLDGGRVCAAVRQDVQLRQTPIIVYSSLSPQDYRFFPQLSADAYVAKGPLTTSAQHIMTVISHFDEGGLEGVEGQRLGYDNYRPRRLVDELLRERSHLASVLRIAAPNTLELNRDGRIIMANPGASEILGKREGELVGELFSAFLPVAHQSVVQELVNDLVQSEEPTQHVTALPLGSTTMIPVRLAPIFEDNVCSGLLVMLGEEEPRREENL
jgi:CheY-like chemotaxis protein